jgi:hypothetical protein
LLNIKRLHCNSTSKKQKRQRYKLAARAFIVLSHQINYVFKPQAPRTMGIVSTTLTLPLFKPLEVTIECRDNANLCTKSLSYRTFHSYIFCGNQKWSPLVILHWRISIYQPNGHNTFFIPLISHRLTLLVRTVFLFSKSWPRLSLVDNNVIVFCSLLDAVMWELSKFIPMTSVSLVLVVTFNSVSLSGIVLPFAVL